MKNFIIALFLLNGLSQAPSGVVSEVSQNGLHLHDGRIVKPALLLEADQDSLLQQEISLFVGKNKQDRHGRLVAHILTQDGKWYQGLELITGESAAHTSSDYLELWHSALSLENIARQNKAGMWENSMQVKEADEDFPYYEGFHIVQGMVQNVAQMKEWTYLNFGEDWRSDFTVVIPAKLAKQMQPENFQDTLVRVRGMVYKRNGAAIEISYPEQIEVIE